MNNTIIPYQRLFIHSSFFIIHSSPLLPFLQFSVDFSLFNPLPLIDLLSPPPHSEEHLDHAAGAELERQNGNALLLACNSQLLQFWFAEKEFPVAPRVVARKTGCILIRLNCGIFENRFAVQKRNIRALQIRIPRPDGFYLLPRK